MNAVHEVHQDTIPTVHGNLPWNELDTRAVNMTRLLAADAVEHVGNGHPGTAMSLAPVAYLLFQRAMRHDPSDSLWYGRDRFVLSCGHTSLTLYNQLFLGGWGLELEDLKQLRTFNSQTPGHPEYHHTKGVELTTGPLGQGLAHAVGMAMSARRIRGLMDPETAEGQSCFDHTIFVIASDGDLQEGITSEASSLAGHQELGNLVVIYDANQISIEDDIDVAFSEDVQARYDAYGWHTQVIDWTQTGRYVEDLHALGAAVKAAQAETDRPSLIVLRTIIGWPAPTKQDTGGIHGSALGAAELAAVKEVMGQDPSSSFVVDHEALQHTRDGLAERAKLWRQDWEAKFTAWEQTHPDRAQLWNRLQQRELPTDWDACLPDFSGETAMATRKASGLVLNAVADVLPELWGGSADLAGSNNTTMKGAESFIPRERSTDTFQGNKYGRTLHFGIREHAMGAICNGITMHGGTRAYGGTFLVFSDYMRPAVRLAALMEVPSIFIWTHDSIGLGEDGPTHQPVEHLTSLRAIPGLDVVRPADAQETVVAWKTILQQHDRPTGLCLTRQDVPVFDRTAAQIAAADGVAQGGYVLSDSQSELRVILLATGSEVQLALAAQKELEAAGVGTRVVSMPCIEWFDAQPSAYRDGVLPPSVRARVSVEAGLAMPWYRYCGDAGEHVSLEHYGASADYETLYQEFGITTSAVVEAAQRSLAKTAQ